MQMAARAWGIEGTRPSQSEVGNLVCATDARRLNTCYNMQWYDLLMYLQVAMSTMHGCIFLRTRDQKSMHLFSSLLVFVSVSTVPYSRFTLAYLLASHHQIQIKA